LGIVGWEVVVQDPPGASSAHEPLLLTPDFGIESVPGDGVAVVAVAR
jgi:hypothetical protein